MTIQGQNSIAGFGAELACIDVDGDPIALWRVADLERHVDRAALLAGDDPAEPPYWAHLWSGAHVLAGAVPRGARATIELGCGLGLPGLVAARRASSVVFVDRAPAALAFVRASLGTNRLRAACLIADVATLALTARFDLVLAAELLYDRRAFGPIARTVARLLAPHGRALLTDAGRTDTRAFYEELDAAALRWTARDESVCEDGFRVTVRLVEITHRA